METVAMRSSKSGGFSVHKNFLTPGLQHPELKLLRAPSRPGQLSCGPTHWLANDAVPKESWLAPAELCSPFRLHGMLEDQMKWFTTQFADNVIPREVLRNHLTEALSAPALDSTADKLGNRTAACQIGRHNLLLSCSGSAGQTVTLRILTCQEAAAEVQCLQQQHISTGKPVHQIAVSAVSDPWPSPALQRPEKQPENTGQDLEQNCSLDSRQQNEQHERSSNDTADGQTMQHAGSSVASDRASEQQHLALVAARGPYQVMILQAQHRASGWALQPLATIHSQQAVCDVTWSSFDPCQGAFICDDGSVHTWLVERQPDKDPTVRTQLVVAGGHAALHAEDDNTSVKKACVWLHPRRIACSSGRNLVQCQLLGLGQKARVVLLHSRPAPDNIVALACPSQAQHPMQCGFLAVATTHHVQLFETCRFHSPILCWAHSMNREPPQLLHLVFSSPLSGAARQDGDPSFASPSETMPVQDSRPYGSQMASSSQPWGDSQAGANYFPRGGHRARQTDPFGPLGQSQALPPTQASQGPLPFETPQTARQGATAAQGHFTGCIIAASLALGACKAFRFQVAPSGQVIAACAPQDAKKKRQTGLRGNWGLIEVQAQSDPGSLGSSPQPSFSWAPRLGNAVQATELPRLVCKPLKPLSDPSQGPPLVDMAQAHGEKGEQMMLQCPDLQGLAVLPVLATPDASGAAETDAQEPLQADYTLFRASFVGDVFLDPCFFFKALPTGHAADSRRIQAAPQSIKIPGIGPGVQSGQPKQATVPRALVTSAPPKRKAGRPKKQRPELPQISPAADGPMQGPNGNALPEGSQAGSAAVPMLRHLDIRQTADNYDDQMRVRHADPRWKTAKSEVRFAQKGLFQYDVSVHHAVLRAALASYKAAAPRDLLDGPGNAWGYDHMPAHLEQMQKASRPTAATSLAEGPNEGLTSVSSLLSNLQGAVTADELAARQRWQAAAETSPMVAGNNEPAVPGAKFRYPDKSAVTARAVHMVQAAYRREKAGQEGSEAGMAVTDFRAAHIVAEACQAASGKAARLSTELKTIPLASWTGSRLGPPQRAGPQGSNLFSPAPDSQTSVHLSQPSPSRAETAASIPVIAADRTNAAAQIVVPTRASTSWAGLPIKPPAWRMPLQMNSYLSDLEPGQEWQDIEALEKLWLDSKGQQRLSQPQPSAQQQKQQRQAAGASAQQSAVSASQSKAADAPMGAQRQHAQPAGRQAGAQHEIQAAHIAQSLPVIDSAAALHHSPAQTAGAGPVPAGAGPVPAGLHSPVAATAAAGATGASQPKKSGVKRKADHALEAQEVAIAQGRREGTMAEEGVVHPSQRVQNPVRGQVPAQETVSSPAKLPRQGQTGSQAKRTKAKHNFVEGF